MRRVWRIEHAETGYGPYTCRSWTGSPFAGFQQVLEDNGKFHDMMNRHPVVGWSAEAQFGSGLRFGFKSEEQLREWFDYFGDYGYDLLRTNGFHLVQYDVEPDAVIEFDRQITFNINKAHAVCEEEL